MLARWEKIFLTVVNSVSLVTGSCTSLLIVVSFFLHTSVREATELFLVSLSVADFLICVVCQPLVIVEINDAGQSLLRLSVISSLGYGLLIASLHGLLAVTVDRFVSIYLPFKYVHWMTERSANKIIVAGWIISLIMAILHGVRVAAITAFTQVHRAVIFTLVPILYGIIYREAMKQARRIVSQCPTLPTAPPKVRRPMYKATKGVGVVLFTTVTLWLPGTTAPIFLAASSLKGDDFLRVIYWCLTLACLNSSINSYLYCWQFPKLRRAVGKSLQRIWARRDAVKRPPFLSAGKLAGVDDQASNQRRAAWLVTERESKIQTQNA